jgi:hypothetical protein
MRSWNPTHHALEGGSSPPSSRPSSRGATPTGSKPPVRKACHRRPFFWNIPDLRRRRVAEITIYLGMHDRLKLALAGSGACRRQTRPGS